jgi:hypothetical protein
VRRRKRVLLGFFKAIQINGFRVRGSKFWIDAKKHTPLVTISLRRSARVGESIDCGGNHIVLSKSRMRALRDDLRVLSRGPATKGVVEQPANTFTL